MKKRLFSITAATAALLATTHLAHADKKSELANLGAVMEGAARMASRNDWNAYELKTAKTPAECRASIAAAKKAGATESDEFEAYGDPGDLIPEDKKGAYGGTFLVPVSHAPKICDAYEAAYEVAKLAVAVQLAFDTEVWMQAVKPEEAGNIEGNTRTSEGCLAAIAATLQAGATADTKIKVKDGEVTIGEARSRCTQILADATAFETKVTERQKAEKAAIVATFTKAGAKGDKLEWLVDRGPGIDGWYLKGCKEPKDVKQLLKASVWFQWFYPPDGGHMIRRIQFKGNKQVKVTERTYETEAKAYKGCK